MFTIEQMRQQWLDDLRSNRYEKCIESLYQDGAFCALGLACDILVRNGQGHWGVCTYICDDSSSGLDYEDCVKNQFYIDGACLCEVITRNDDGDTFEEIADYLEWWFNENPVATATS